MRRLKPTHITKAGVPVCRLTVRHTIHREQIVEVIADLLGQDALTDDESARPPMTRERVSEAVDRTLWSSGFDGMSYGTDDRYGAEYATELRERARPIAVRLFPAFFETRPAGGASS